ncbi:ATP-dependent RNA helicase [Phaffia rhodozyma]|uniref:RNA helicase n=1 Tax=Phaffia rhodozyma TaxID=264483 RepID=A0A0F7SPE9_PHARH|nr:ATP-dependent RNA helicase [Phaffia rhodozyma]
MLRIAVPRRALSASGNTIRPFSISCNLARGSRTTTGGKIMQSMRGVRNKDLKSLPAKKRLAPNFDNRRDIHPDLLRPARSRLGNSTRRLPPTVKANPLIVGSTGSVITAPRTFKAVSNAKKGLVASKSTPKQDFVFQAQPLQRSPPNASKFKSHPTLTGLPIHFTSPPVRPNLVASVAQYLKGILPESADSSLVATPVQRLSLQHFFPQALDIEASANFKLKKNPLAKPSEFIPRGMRPGAKTLLAAETGSGKTLAYVLPIIQALKDEEDSGKMIDEDDEEASATRLRPRALIIAPTHELARQIDSVISALTHRDRLQTTCLSSGSGSGPDSGVFRYPEGADIVVGTINRIKELMGLPSKKDQQLDERDSKLENAVLKKLIDAEVEKAKKFKDDDWKNTFRGAKSKDVWMPDKRKTWLENIQDRENEKRAAEGKPEWTLPVKIPKRHEKREHLSLERVKWLVLDEADVSLAEPFLEDVNKVINPLLTSPTPPNFIMATATVPETLSKILQKEHPTCTRLITPNLHRLPHTLALSTVNWTGSNWRSDVLMEIRRAFVEDAREGKENSQTIVFINKDGRAKDFGSYLTEKGFPNVVIQSASGNRTRGTNKHIAPFLVNPRDQLVDRVRVSSSVPVKASSVGLQPWEEPKAEPRILITTGVLSRGLDFAPTVGTIIMCDEPKNAVDFIHRAGRAGRAGNDGRVIIFSKTTQPVKRAGGGAGRGGAMYKTIQMARARFEGRGKGARKGGGAKRARQAQR